MRRSALQGFFIGGQQYCAEAIALFARITGQQPSTALKELCDLTIRDGLTKGWWSGKDQLYISMVHTEEFAHLNWIKNLHNSVNVNSLPWLAKEGFKGGGTGKYIDQNYRYSQAVNYQLFTNFSIGLMVFNKPNSATTQINGGSTASGLVNYGTSARWYHNSSGYASFVGAVAENDVYALNSSLSGITYRDSYKNGNFYYTAGFAANIAENDTTYKELLNAVLSGRRAFWRGASMTAQNHTDIYNALMFFKNNVGSTF